MKKPLVVNADDSGHEAHPISGPLLLSTMLLYGLGFLAILIWALVDNNIAKVLLIYSNVLFLLPAIKATELHRWTMAALYVLMIVASAVYHSNNNWTGSTVLSADILRKEDFFYAQLLIVITALYLIQFPLRWAFIERWLIMLAAVAIFWVEVETNEPFAAQVAIVGVAAALIIAYWIVYACLAAERKTRRYFPPYDWEALAMGIGLSALACVLFATQIRWHLGYPWVHSAWHQLAALGQFFILCTRKAAPRNAALDSNIKRHVI